jgi:uncharacterized protein (TIGR03437 family)
LTQVTLNNGSAYVVYEVVNANPLAFETAQIPVFILPPAGTMPPNGCATGTQPELSVNLAPVSTVATATATDPLPRFVLVTPPSDCTLNGDCGSSYFPSFSVSTATLNLTATAGGLAQTSVLQVTNTSTDAYLSFNVSVTYLSGSNWLTVNPGSGIGTTALVLTANPSALSAGVYNAIITISAGAAGTVSIPVALTVGSATPIIQSVVSAADFLAPVVPGSFIAIFGVTLSGQNPTVTFDGQPAQIVYDGSSQINVLAPATFTGAGSTTSVVVSVNGAASNTFVANTTANAPGIFNPGIRNQDNSINTQSQPATVGSEIQIFLTGFTLPLTVPVTVQIGGQSNLPPVYAGGVPSVPGLDQVNVVVPPSASPGTNGVPLRICIPGLFGTPYCSNAVNLFVQ